MTAGSSSAPLAGAPSDAPRPRPFVSVLLPVHNELDELRECLAALARQTYPHDRFEVLVADGSDEPVDLAVVPSELDLAIVPNPAQVMTVGLNLVAKRARGDYVAIVSAHSSLPDEYLERIVETARSTGAANVGTRIRKVARSAWGRAIAAATSSPFGVGSSVQHHGSSAGPADSAFPGFIARSAFDALGGFNTALACNEDDEFNARLRAAGGGVWYEPAIEVVYRPRETLAGAFYQHFRYGRWKVAVARLGIPGYLRPRHAIPSLTVLGAMGLPLLGLYRRRLAPLTLVAAAAYGLLSAVEGYRMARRHDASAWRAAFVFPVVHAGYGLGFLRGLLDRGLPDEGRSRRRRLEAGSDPERRPAPEPRTSAAGSGGGGLAARAAMTAPPDVRGETSQLPTIVLVGDQGSVHVERWREGLRALGHPIVTVHLSGRGRSWPAKARQLVGVRRRLSRLARRPNTIVAVHYVRGGFAATALRGVHPVVLSVWGRDVTEPHGGAWGRVYGWQQRALVRRADAVTATSAFLAGVVRRRFGVEAEVVPFGIDLERFHPAEREPAVAAGEEGPQREPALLRIGFVKWLEPKYGPHVLVEALGLLRDAPFRATLVGDGELEPTLRRRAAELGIGDRVAFLGRRPHAEIPELLRGFDVFAMPSREEAWGVAAAEASASGLPVVATCVGGIPEIVLDGQTGLLVPPDDPAALAAAIRRLAEDPALRRRLGAAGRARIAELLPWARCVRQMSELYVRAADRGRRAR